MHALTQDLRFASRQLRKAPGFSLTVVLILALGIGATTAIFSLVESILLRPLPFSRPDRLVLLGDHLGNRPAISVTGREVAVYSDSAGAFSSMGGYISTSYELSGGATPEEINGARFTVTVFPTLGVRPLLGRTFTQQEDEGHQPVAVISYSLWLNRFQRDPNVLGKTIALDRKAYTIIGVMPRGFEFPLATGHLDQAQIWVPMSFTPSEVSPESGVWGYQIVARLKDGVTFSQAAQDADRVARQIKSSFPPSMSTLQIRGDVISLMEYDVSEIRPLLRSLFLAVVIVLLLACVNVAGLMLVRAIRRKREYAVRLALGARPGAILRQSLFESLLLSSIGGLFGLGLAALAIRTAVHLLPESMPRIDSISIDATVALFVLFLAVATGAICSLAPAFAALRTNLTESLKDGVRTSGGSHHAWLRSTLVVSEIAIALVLLLVSGAFLRSFQKMRAVDPGFRPDHLLVASYRLPVNQYPENSSVESFDQVLVDRLSSKPGVTAIGITTALPATDVTPLATYTIEDQPANSWKLKFAAFSITYGDYFRAMDIPLLDGRYFNIDDRADSPLVVMVNQSMARHCWPGQRAVGKRIHLGNPQKGLPWATVVGVVADTKRGSPDEPSDDQWYFPAEQPAILDKPEEHIARTFPAAGYIALRAAVPPDQMTKTLRSTVAEIDPLLALQQVQPMTEVISNIEQPRRFNTDLITAFALGALMLAITGIYAVIAFTVSLRTQEIAIRMALGAQRVTIAQLVLTWGLKLALIGCGLGVLGSVAASRLVRSFLFEVSPTDPLIYTVGVVIMLVMAAVASAVPATRAASTDPVEALRAL